LREHKFFKHIPSANRVILLGGGMLYAKLFSFCKGNGFEVIAITSKRHLAAPADSRRTLGEFLAQEQIRYHSLNILNEQRLKRIAGNMDRSLAITLGAPWKISKSLIEKVFADKIFNCHGTRLPTYRGGAMYSWNILRGNRLGLCLLQRLNETDTGEIVSFEEFVYPPSCRVPFDYEATYTEKNVEFLGKFLLRARGGPVEYSPVGQPEYLSSFFPRLSSKVNGWISWEWTLEDVERFICAFDEPYPGALTTVGGQTVRLKEVVAQQNDGRNHPYQNGLVYRNNGRWLMVSCGEGELIVHKVLDGQNRNIVGEIKAGERFVTPGSRLESAKGSAHFSPDGQTLTGRSDPLIRFAGGPNGNRARQRQSG